MRKTEQSIVYDNDFRKTLPLRIEERVVGFRNYQCSQFAAHIVTNALFKAGRAPDSKLNATDLSRSGIGRIG